MVASIGSSSVCCFLGDFIRFAEILYIYKNENKN